MLHLNMQCTVIRNSNQRGRTRTLKKISEIKAKIYWRHYKEWMVLIYRGINRCKALYTDLNQTLIVIRKYY